MALSPNEALAVASSLTLTDDEAADLLRCEEKIDSFLKTEWSGGGGTFRFNLTLRTVSAIHRRYALAGWNVAIAQLEQDPSGISPIVTFGKQLFVVALQPQWAYAELREDVTTVRVALNALLKLIASPATSQGDAPELQKGSAQ